MKNSSKLKPLRLGRETVRNLQPSQLVDVVGGSLTTQSNNGCGSAGSIFPTLCRICVR